MLSAWLAKLMHSPLECYMDAIQRILRYLKSTLGKEKVHYR